MNSIFSQDETLEENIVLQNQLMLLHVSHIVRRVVCEFKTLQLTTLF